ncbi:MAG TPA: O-antigen ligase family protein [Flavisolibacter sp.]|nr:O-antigen ligase family protein [Flavisolibacter sp.]
MTPKEKILYCLLLLFFCTFFYADTDTPNGIITGVLLVYSFFFFSPLKEKWRLLKERKHILFMLLFFGMIGVSLFLSDDRAAGVLFLDRRLPLIYFPVGIGLLHLRKEFKEKILLGLASITTLVCFGCLLYAIYASGFFKRPELLYNDSLTHVIGRQSIYISLLVTISIFIFGYSIFFKTASGQKKSVLLLATLFLFMISYLLASRNMMLVLYAFTVCFLFYFILKRKKYLEGVTLLMAMGLGIFLVFKFFPQTINRFKELSYTKFDYGSMGKESHYNMAVTAGQWNGANFRLAAWPCGWDLFTKHPVVGVGLGDKQVALREAYRRKNFQFGVTTNKNIHNNYLDILISTGLTGLLLFMLGWLVLPVYYAVKHKDWLVVIIVATVAFAMFTEVYFDRTFGGMLVGFLVPFLLTDIEQKKN